MHHHDVIHKVTALYRTRKALSLWNCSVILGNSFVCVVVTGTGSAQEKVCHLPFVEPKCILFVWPRKVIRNSLPSCSCSWFYLQHPLQANANASTQVCLLLFQFRTATFTAALFCWRSQNSFSFSN